MNINRNAAITTSTDAPRASKICKPYLLSNIYKLNLKF